jgi:type I restriction enzyme, S subunit
VDRDWIGHIPETWDVAMLKFVARLESGHTPSRAVPAYWENCTLPWFTLSDVWQLREDKRKYVYSTEELVSELGIANSSARMLPAGTVILSRTASVGFTGILGCEMATTQDFVNWVCGERLNPEYLWYCLQAMAPEYERLRFGSTHQTIYMPDVAQFKVPLPPRDEQARISRFLDETILRIDALIAEKTRLVARLGEYRKSIATTAVTQGLPGIHSEFVTHPFLGPIPVAWQIGKFRHYVQVKSGQVDPENDAYRTMPLIAPNHIESGTGRLLNTETALEQSAESGKYWCDAGDVIYSKIRPGLRKATIAPFDCLCSADMYPLKAKIPLTNKYLFWYLLSEPFSVFAEQESMRVAMPKLNRETIADAVIPLPHPQEQAAIVKHIEGTVTGVDSVIGHAAEHIDRLHEYRSSLISAAVTGQLAIPC